jgi:hypothetical protein
MQAQATAASRIFLIDIRVLFTVQIPTPTLKSLQYEQKHMETILSVSALILIQLLIV